MATSDKIKLAVISHAFAQEMPRKRWRLLAEQHDFEVHLLVPKVWEQRWFGERIQQEVQAVHDGDFHVHPIPSTDKRNWSRYFFISLDARFRAINPDLIYIIHEEQIWVHQQIYLYRQLWARHAKIIFFSMHALGVPLEKMHQRWRWRRTQLHTEAALVHYPGCRESLRDAGYNKPIFLQTQVGVDDDLFQPDADARTKIRKDLGLSGKFVIGYVGRLVEDKGVDDLVNILPLQDCDWALLLVGNGPLYDWVQQMARRHGWEDRLHLPGYVPPDEVPAYMNAMDCLVHGAKTKPYWIDTFPLTTVQAQACGVPVIASDSASLPWQLDETALFFPEGDQEQMEAQIRRMAHEPQLRRRLAQDGRQRALAHFSVRVLTDNFVRIADQVLNDSYCYAQPGQGYQQDRAY